MPTVNFPKLQVLQIINMIKCQNLIKCPKTIIISWHETACSFPETTNDTKHSFWHFHTFYSFWQFSGSFLFYFPDSLPFFFFFFFLFFIAVIAFSVNFPISPCFSRFSWISRWFYRYFSTFPLFFLYFPVFLVSFSFSAQKRIRVGPLASLARGSWCRVLKYLNLLK